MVIKTADFPMKNVIKKNFCYKHFDNKDFNGNVSLISIIESNHPLLNDNNEPDLASTGFKWLEFYSKNSKIAMTAYYDNKNNIVQWYFDVINSEGINSENIPYIEDLYLDIILKPNKEITLLDEDELKVALENNDITKKQFDDAYEIANKLIKRLEQCDIKKIIEFSNKYFEKLI